MNKELDCHPIQESLGVLAVRLKWGTSSEMLKIRSCTLFIFNEMLSLVYTAVPHSFHGIHKVPTDSG